MHKILTAVAMSVSTVASVIIVPSPVAAQDTQYAIRHIDGSLYRWTAGSYHSVYIVHDEGIAVADPLSAQAATWLRGELARRHPNKQITHVIYSHSHPDHAYGGEALDDGDTIFIAHELAAETWKLNQANVRMPDVVFYNRLTITLPGAGDIRLDYWGANNGKGSVSMLFPQQHALHVVDWIVIGRLPYQTLDGYDINGMISSTRAILSDMSDKDFSVFIGGHADIGTREDIEFYLSYLEALHDGVLRGIIAGQSLEAIQNSLDLSNWSSLKQFDAWRDANIEGVFNQLIDDYYVTMRPEVPDPG
ncbi:MBL fold metallo-hydrolase [Erythrobacter litoralis]|uniref:MBL fold metallo-hydrolase n=1 Tax=Erythrobacter litoralis TaxID=39960 RepID=UPI0024350F39|nr:MBL fold metallo-hydrolase [Erythrobacter litoralis]MDG6080256.1 MBL fold metallo-hydrolase [Erythrobacter litoralis]